MRRFRGFVEADDLKQECYTYAAAKNNQFKDLLNDPDDNKRRHNERNIGWQLKRVAERYARKEKATKGGYSVTDETFYDTTTIAQLLPFVISSVLKDTPLDQAQVMVDDGTPKRPSAPAESGNFLAILIDIKKAYLLLEPEDAEVLERRYYDGWTLQQLAEWQECAVSTADRRCNTAMNRLQDNLGGESPYA